MKKYFILNFFIFIYIIGFSQSFHGGLNLGATISQVDGDSHSGFHKVFPSGGVYVRTEFLNSDWGISMSILYKNKGSRSFKKNEYGDVIDNYAIKLHYIEVPFLFTYLIKKIGIPGLFEYKFKRDLYIELGPSFGYLIKGTEYFDNLDYRTIDFKRYEIALHAGLTYGLNDHWFLNFRYSYTFPFLPIAPHPGGQVYWLNRGMYNNNMNFSLIYEF
ncbi:MAG: PorT family protein [Bacteroidales bacterium]|nr:PorT family protein [Bacteroidales bacterium]